MNCYLPWNLKDMTNISAEKLQRNLAQQVAYLDLYRNELIKEAYRFNIASILKYASVHKASFGNDALSKKATDCLLVFLHAIALRKQAFFTPSDSENSVHSKGCRNLHRLMLENLKATLRYIDYSVLLKRALGQTDINQMFSLRDELYHQVLPEETIMDVCSKESINDSFFSIVDRENSTNSAFIDYDVQNICNLDSSVCELLSARCGSLEDFEEGEYGILGSIMESLKTPFIKHSGRYYSFVTRFSLPNIHEKLDGLYPEVEEVEEIEEKEEASDEEIPWDEDEVYKDTVDEDDDLDDYELFEDDELLEEQLEEAEDAIEAEEDKTEEDPYGGSLFDEIEETEEPEEPVVAVPVEPEAFESVEAEEPEIEEPEEAVESEPEIEEPEEAVESEPEIEEPEEAVESEAPVEVETPAEPVPEAPAEPEAPKPETLSEPLLLLDAIAKSFTRENALTDFVDQHNYEERKEISNIIDSALQACIKDGRDKMFTIPNTKISVVVFKSSIDPMLEMQRRQNVGAMMYINQADSWGALELPVNEVGGMLPPCFATITRNSFTDWQWRLVEKMGQRLLERRK